MTIKKKIPVTQDGSLYTDNLYSGSTFVIWLKLENVSVTVMNGNEADNIFKFMKRPTGNSLSFMYLKD